MSRYGREYDRGFGRGAARDGWRGGPGRDDGNRGRYGADMYRSQAPGSRGGQRQPRRDRGWVEGYDNDHSFGYGDRGLYGASMYGGGRYGRDYLGAWVPGGWSAQHGREHSGVRDPGRFGRDPRHFRGAGPYSDGAPTG